MVMAKYAYKGKFYTIAELAGFSGIAEHTIRDRLRRGYPIEQAVRPVVTDTSVEEFGEASWWEDWIGMPTEHLHKIYWKWCVSNGYTPLSKQPFSRHLLKLYPQLKTVPSRVDGNCMRVIRLR